MAEGLVWIRKLKVARGEAERATEIRALRSVARKLSIDCNSKDLETARAIAIKRIDELIATQEAQLQKLRSPSPTSSSSWGSLASRRSSVSSAARATPAPPSAAAAQAAQPQGTPTSGPLLLRSSGPLVVCPAPTSSDTQTDEEVPAGPLTQLLLESRLLTAEKEIAHFYEELQQTRMGLKEEVMQALAGLKAEPAEEENARLKEELAQVKESNRKLLEQSRTTQAAQLRMQHEMEAMQRQLEEVLAAQSSFMHTRDAVSILHTEQQQLQAQQRLDECKQCIVFKDSEPLPAKGAAAHLQSKLSKALDMEVTVQSVKQLGRQPSPSEQGARQRPPAYKVTLGSSGERTQVLRHKAKALRGTCMSIGPLLTPDQLALEHKMRPVARQAKAAGKRVQWHYGSLVIDGKEYTGAGSLPTPTKPSRGGHSHTAAGASRKTSLPSTVGGRFAALLDEEGKEAVEPVINRNAAAATREAPMRAASGSGSVATKQKVKGGRGAASKEKVKGVGAPVTNQGGGGITSVGPKAAGGDAPANPSRGNAAAKPRAEGCNSPSAHPLEKQGKGESKAVSVGASSAAAEPRGARPASSSKAPSPSSPTRA